MHPCPHVAHVTLEDVTLKGGCSFVGIDAPCFCNLSGNLVNWPHLVNDMNHLGEELAVMKEEMYNPDDSFAESVPSFPHCLALRHGFGGLDVPSHVVYRYNMIGAPGKAHDQEKIRPYEDRGRCSTMPDPAALVAAGGLHVWLQYMSDPLV